jgi:integrase
MVKKRSYGTGRMFEKHGAWYGSWRTADGRRTTRKIGPVRKGREGLSKTQAEAALREMVITEARRPIASEDDLTVSQLGRLLLNRLETDGRKPSHIESVRYHLSKHIDPLLGDLPASQVLEADVRRLVDRMHRAGKAPKTIRNVAGTLHSVLGQVLKDNPCDMAKLPATTAEPQIRFLTQDELERVLIAPPPADASRAERDWWPVVRLLVLTAAMTGMRLGELRALRWSDLDFGAMKVRVRFSFVRGQMGAPKSRRSVRAVPLASRLVAELETHHRATVWNQDSDLVLAHPHTGRPLDRVRLLQHFKAALERADVRPVRIHDLRHTFATTIAASGDVSMRTLQEWMGHLDARTTQIYADYMPDAREQAMVDAAFAPRGLQLDSNSVRSDVR